MASAGNQESMHYWLVLGWSQQVEASSAHQSMTRLNVHENHEVVLVSLVAFSEGRTSKSVDSGHLFDHWHGARSTKCGRLSTTYSGVNAI